MNGIHVEDRGAARWLILDRPECRNALDPTVLPALTEAIRAANDARVIVLAGRKACSGAISALVKASTLTASIQASISISSSRSTTQSIRPYYDGGDSGITYLFLA